MSNKSLNASEIEQLKEMAIRGDSPKDIAAFFGIGIASVHNHKSKLKDDGVKMPGVRGKRAKGFIEGADYSGNQALKDIPERTITTPDGSYRFTVNGRPVVVIGPVKNIIITSEGMEVNY